MCSAIPEQLVSFFKENADSYPKGTYEKNLLRFMFVKAIEERIADDFYRETARGKVKNIFYSPLDVDLDVYPMNLPLHLETLVNEQRKVADEVVLGIIEALGNAVDSDMEDILVGVFCYAQFYGIKLGKENRIYKSYDCSNMLTRNELLEAAGSYGCKWLENGGFCITETSFNKETYQNIVANRNGKMYYVLLSTEVEPVKPVFTPRELDSYYVIAQEDGAVPALMSVTLRSKDEKHFADGIILAGDETKFKVNCFDELIIDDNKVDRDKYLSRDITEVLRE